MTQILVQVKARKSGKNKPRSRGGIVGGARAGANTGRRAATHTMHATAGGLPFVAEVGARDKEIKVKSAVSRRNSMSNGNANAPTRDADAEARARVEAIARAMLHNNSDAREAFVALKAVLLTVILDDGKESVEWELDSGDWVLLRVSDFADLEGRERGDLFPVTP